MDEGELDDWFQQEKEKIDELFEKDLMADIVHPEVVKERYDKSYKKLIRIYQRKQSLLYNSQVRHEQIQKPIHAYEEALKRTNARIVASYKNTKLAIKKWLFDIKFKVTVLK